MSTITKDPLMDILTDRVSRELDEEFIRQSIERLKQTGEYDELVKKRQAVLDAQKTKEEK